MLVNFMSIWSILQPFRIFYGHLVYFVVILVYFSRFGMLKEDKSGNRGKSLVYNTKMILVVRQAAGLTQLIPHEIGHLT
jgi:predicted metal-dependent peptidase